MPGIRFNRAFEVIRGAKAFVNLECGLTRGAVPNPRQQVQDQARNLKHQKNRVANMRQRLREKDQEIVRLKKRLEADELEAEPQGRESGSGSARDLGTLPDYLIIGAQKSGTTSLYGILTQHSHVMPAARKEVHYFDSNRFNNGSDWYRSNFSAAACTDGQKLITGEASPYYIYHPLAAKRVAELVPNAKLIALLRNPVDRAYSDYQHRFREGLDTLSFEGAIEAEEERIRGEKEKMLADGSYNSRSLRRHSYLSKGIYIDQLREWHRYFDESQILVLKSEDLAEHTAETVNAVLEFLGLPAWDREDFGESKNVGAYEPMSPETRERLEVFFQPHNQRLYEYLGRDFGW